MNNRLSYIMSTIKILQGLGVELLGEKDLTVSESAYADMFASYNGKTQACEGRWYIYTIVDDFWIGTFTDHIEKYICLEESNHD